MKEKELAPEAARAAPRLRRALFWALRVGGTLAGFGYVASRVEPAEVGPAMAKIDPLAFLAACALTLVNLGVGAVRWRVLLAAYGAPRRPSIATLYRVYLVGFFYNTYLPGGLGGDVVRGVVTRASFGARGATASLTVVLVERVLGLAGLLIVVSASYLWRPLHGATGVLPYSALGLALACGAVVAIALGRRLGDVLPGRLGETAAALPALERGASFALALAISLVTQALVALGGWLLIDSVAGGRVAFSDALVLVPLAAAASYFPLTVGGAGAREAAFVALARLALDMAEADALACALAMWLAQLAVGALGGLAQLARPVREASAEPEGA